MLESLISPQGSGSTQNGSVPVLDVCTKEASSSFHFSESWSGIICFSEDGKLVLKRVCSPDQTGSDSPMIENGKKLLFEEGYGTSTLSDIRVWLRAGWFLEEVEAYSEASSTGDSDSDSSSASGVGQLLIEGPSKESGGST
jgi:hypothetical protein